MLAVSLRAIRSKQNQFFILTLIFRSGTDYRFKNQSIETLYKNNLPCLILFVLENHLLKFLKQNIIFLFAFQKKHFSILQNPLLKSLLGLFENLFD